MIVIDNFIKDSAFLKQLEENKKLKEASNAFQDAWIAKVEENKKLKEEIDDAVENHFADLKLRETTHKEWGTLQEENKKLKEKNKELSEEMKYSTLLTGETIQYPV